MAENEPFVDDKEARVETLASGGQIDLRGRYTIHPDQPLVHLNSPTAAAFSARMRLDPNRSLMALACHTDLPPRTDALEALRGYNLGGMLKPLDWGRVVWPGEQNRRFVILLERPGGARVMPSLGGAQAGMGEEELVTGLFQPLLSTFREFVGRMVAHRSIRPDNLFFIDGGRRQMVLGEGFSAPPAYDQPAVFETIESSMAHRTGRGNGGQANDLYSFGVTVLFLILGRNPVGDLDQERLLANKIELGSYASLVGQQRIPLGLMEPLRGMLTDDPRERWTVTDLDMWLSGRRLSPKQPKLPQRASRPFVFQEIEFFNTRALAMSFAKDYSTASSVVRSKALDSWLRRSLNDETRADAVQAAVSSNSGSSGRSGEDRLVARAILPLDPAAPIRYRGFGVTLDGIGPALAAAMHNRERRQVISEIISSRLPVYWVGAQGKPKAEDLRAVQLLEKLPGVIDQPMIGYGVERCLYELNLGEVCHSPLFEQDYVTDIGHVIPALEAVARSNNRPDMPMDRHIVGFVAARARRVGDELLRGLGHAQHETRALALLRLYALVQDQTSSSPAPALAQWLANMLAPVVSSYHLRKRRTKIQERVQRVAQDGVLSDLLAAVDDQSERVADQVGFNEAVSEYRGLDYSLRSFQAEKQKRDEEGRLLGEQIAAAIGGILVSVSMAVSVFVYFA